MPVRKEHEFDLVEDYKKKVVVIIRILIKRYYGGSNYYSTDVNRYDSSWIKYEESKEIDKESENMQQSVIVKWPGTKESIECQESILAQKNKSDIEPLLVSQYHHIGRSHAKKITDWFGDLLIDEFAEKILIILKIPFTLPLSNNAALFLCKEEWVKRHSANRRLSSLVERYFVPDFWEIGKRFIFEDESDSNHFIYKKSLYQVTGNHTAYSEEHKKLLVMKEADKERKEFERLKALYESESAQEIKRNREPISEEVRVAVWRRDSGICVRCGSKERLEYDHIIPISKGGSNTARNIQLLCEKCNREKSDNI